MSSSKKDHASTGQFARSSRGELTTTTSNTAATTAPSATTTITTTGPLAPTDPHSHTYRQPPQIVASLRGNMLVRIPPSNPEVLTGTGPPVFKLPKRPRVVLEEDEYIEALRRIVARDYFPENDYIHDRIEAIDREILRLRQHNDLMESGESNELDSAIAAERFLNQLSEAQDLLTDTRNQPMCDSEQMEYDIRHMNLSQFQTKYTSEDNASFHSLLEKSNNDKRLRNAWLWQQNDRFKNNRANPNNKLITQSGSRSSQSAAIVGSWDIKDPKNTVMFQPSGNFVSSKSQAHQRSKKEVPQNTRFPLLASADQDLTKPIISHPMESSTKPQSVALRLFPLEGTESDPLSSTEILDAIRKRPRSYSNASMVSIPDEIKPNSYEFLTPIESPSTPEPTTAPFYLNEPTKREQAHVSLTAHRTAKKKSKLDSSKSGGLGLHGSVLGSTTSKKRKDVNLTPAGARVLNSLRSKSRSGGSSSTPGAGGLGQIFDVSSGVNIRSNLSKK